MTTILKREAVRYLGHKQSFFPLVVVGAGIPQFIPVLNRGDGSEGSRLRIAGDMDHGTFGRRNYLFW